MRQTTAIFYFLGQAGLAGCHDSVGQSQNNVELCDPADCPGPAPGAPNYLCEDGTTIAGPACVRGRDACHWDIVECDACARNDCPSPIPGAPNYLCEDGVTIAGPACLPTRENACAWQIITCPVTDACAWKDCPAPAPGAPNYLCDDGQTVAGPACQLAADNTCAWTIVACP